MESGLQQNSGWMNGGQSGKTTTLSQPGSVALALRFMGASDNGFVNVQPYVMINPKPGFDASIDISASQTAQWNAQVDNYMNDSTGT